MSTRDNLRNTLMIGACVFAWSIANVLIFAIGQKHGRDQVYLKEVECVTHPLKEHKVLCKKARTTEELEIQWKS